MQDLLAQFIPEARDLLEQAGAGMLTLEQDAGSLKAVNNAFRAVHTLKGSSGLFDIAPLTRLMHAAEDILDEVRTGDLMLNSDIVDRLLDSLDVVGRWIDRLETHQNLPADAENTMTERVTRLRQWLAPAGNPATAHGAQAGATDKAGAPAWILKWPEADRIKALEGAVSGNLIAWTYTPDADCFFRGEDPVAMVRQAPATLAVRVMANDGLPTLEMVDPLVSFLRFEVISEAMPDELAHHLRYVMETVKISDISIENLIFAVGVQADEPGLSDIVTAMRAHILNKNAEAFAQCISDALEDMSPETLQASTLRWCRVVFGIQGFNHPQDFEHLLACLTPVPDASRITAPAAADTPEHQTYQLALEQIAMLEVGCDPAIQAGRVQSASKILTHLALMSGPPPLVPQIKAAMARLQTDGSLKPLRDLVEHFRPAALRPALAHPPVGAGTETPESLPGAVFTEGKALPRVLRVDQGKIDELMNLVAELIVAKNGLSYLANRVETVHGSKIIAREIRDQFAIVDRVTQGLHAGVMSVRMMPVGQIFQRFPRLVRDISRKLGKKITLVIVGEDTEADKNILESLADPLIHIVRNCLDHGFELPEERREAGKAEQGTLRISARQDNEFVAIEVSDDGRGIDVNRVKAKGRSLGLFSDEELAQMSDEDAVQIVFLPGFSTNEHVSDLSGRGVGMDVVKSAVQKAGGHVSLVSKMGAGTSVVVRLPLTMAVTRIVTIACRDQIFGIPMDQLIETVRVRREDLKRMKDKEFFVLRETIIPVIRLAEALIFETAATRTRCAEESVMVVRVGRELIGVIVDGFRERLEVIVKPLEGVLEHVEGFSGTALLGDGQVLLILNLQELL